MIRAVIFDFYGVVCADAYQQWLHEHVANLPSKQSLLEEISARSDQGALTKAEFYTAVGQVAGVAPEVVEAGLGAEMIVDEGVLSLIEQLRETGRRVGLLSNSPITLHEALAVHRLHPYFDAVLTSEQVGCAKPESGMFAAMLATLGVWPHEVVFIDDRAPNVQAAQALGLRAHQFKDARHLLEALQRDQVLVKPQVGSHF